MSDSATKHLSRVDPVMRGVISRIGPLAFKPRTRRSPYETLVRSVAYQQLNGRAAESILQRFIALFPGEGFPSPESVLAASDEAMRASGFSRRKVLAIRDIAARTLDGVVPPRRIAVRMDDEALIKRLTEVRGVGRWTVEMLLIFTLGREDVLPVDDYGVRAGYMHAYRKRELPPVKKLREFGERWQPFRTTAALYLWQVAARAGKP